MTFLLERIRRRAQELHKIEYYTTKDISEDNG
jgi:hypothetical protein